MGGDRPHVGGGLVRDVDVRAVGADADPRLVAPRLRRHLDRGAPRDSVVGGLAEHHVVAVHERGVDHAVRRDLQDGVVLPLHARALTQVRLGPPAHAVVRRDTHVHRDAGALVARLGTAEPVVHRVDVRGVRVGGDRRLPRVLHAELDLAGPSRRRHTGRHGASLGAVMLPCAAALTGTPTCSAASRAGSSPSGSPLGSALGGRLARVLRPLDGPARRGARRDPRSEEITTPTSTTVTATTITATSDPLRIPHPLAE